MLSVESIRLHRLRTRHPASGVASCGWRNRGWRQRGDPPHGHGGDRGRTPPIEACPRSMALELFRICCLMDPVGPRDCPVGCRAEPPEPRARPQGALPWLHRSRASASNISRGSWDPGQALDLMDGEDAAVDHPPSPDRGRLRMQVQQAIQRIEGDLGIPGGQHSPRMDDVDQLAVPQHVPQGGMDEIAFPEPSTPSSRFSASGDSLRRYSASTGAWKDAGNPASPISFR